MFSLQIASAVAAFFTLAAVALGAMQFSVGSRSSYLKYSIGICYYLQVRTKLYQVGKAIRNQKFNLYFGDYN